MQGKEWIEREKQRRHPHLDLFGDERRKCEKERMDAERLFHTFRLQPKKQPSAKKMPKQGIKVPPTWLINFSADPSGLRADPGLHLSRTRVSMMGTPGSQAALQAVFDKRKACLDEKRSRFNRFRICSRTVPVFIV